MFKALKNRNIVMLALLILSVVVTACGSRAEMQMKNPQRSMYYWRTTFSLTDGEQQFLARHSVRRLYLRLFDLVREGADIHPSATIDVKTPLPDSVDVVPVVFMNVDLLSGNADLQQLPQRLVSKVERMMALQKREWHELQIDFDWTMRNQERYFELLSRIRTELAKQGRGLSVTIRLHQLAMTPPPADYGALMVYNIGDYTDIHEPNSILSEKNLQPYLKYLEGYQLPLTTALPLYQWDLLFHEGKFAHILRNANLSDTALYRKVSEDRWVVVRYHQLDNGNVAVSSVVKVRPGDTIRHEACSPDMLGRVAQTIKKEREDAMQQLILYSLDEQNIKYYNDDEIENLYRCR